MEFIKSNMKLDARGLACPMPIVKTRKAMKELESGQVIEVQATDKGSKADIKAWAESTGNQYLGTIENGEVLRHYLRKSSDENTVEKKFEKIVTNEQLDQKLQNENTIVLDVREEAEYVFNHIPNAVSIPLGELENRLSELDKEHEIYIICRTGNRSDFAAQLLASNGFTNVFNVLPGMSEWSGETVSIKG
ncbi:sulfurtransferase TusA family protein [Bacillus sp. AFS041924]|uniref:sulfurtransferase TusA family protein n=1 Tax=Bacillus sp. AFS041924 TaxID=2033503 RepID=UPI000BFDDC2E|nr:sulfurtransferase TusA family protein [Bacillus sp. AFS041924]PGS55896.1 hypothetical protein COC46_02760 [Bacillus sp. AFS041924]